MYKLYIPVIFFILCFYHSFAESCVRKNTCECEFQNRSVIDLRSLGYHDKPRWENRLPKDKSNFTYSYNPCFAFKMGPADQSCAKGVAVCQYNEVSKTYENCGDSDSVRFEIKNNKLMLHYSASERSTLVNLICSEDALDPILDVKGMKSNLTYEMTLISRCACPDLCRPSQLSAGSVLVIIFMIFLALYLVLGIVHSSLTRGAYGWELIPHYEFWADFPLLVRDGCVFVISGCKTETAYERI